MNSCTGSYCLVLSLVTFLNLAPMYDTFPLRSRGTLDIERFKNLVSLTLEAAEEKLKTSWYSRVLELFTGGQRMVRGRLGAGFHDSISTLLANQVSITQGTSLSLFISLLLTASLAAQFNDGGLHVSLLPRRHHPTPRLQTAAVSRRRSHTVLPYPGRP